MRVGIDYDVHCLVSERPLILGGVVIPHRLGLAGHSDADVLVHAIMDALLGACGQGDIGKHFPDTNDRYQDISSLKLLGQVSTIIFKTGYTVNNIDAVIIAQAPRVAPYIQVMQQNIAGVLGIKVDLVNIKATTTEKLGFAGREEGIAAQAVVLLKSIDEYDDKRIN